MTEISNLNFDSLKEYYSLELIGGKLGTLLLKRGQNLKAFNRTISPFAITRAVSSDSGHSSTCSN